MIEWRDSSCQLCRVAMGGRTGMATSMATATATARLERYGHKWFGYSSFSLRKLRRSGHTVFDGLYRISQIVYLRNNIDRENV